MRPLGRRGGAGLLEKVTFQQSKAVAGEGLVTGHPGGRWPLRRGPKPVGEAAGCEQGEGRSLTTFLSSFCLGWPRPLGTDAGIGLKGRTQLWFPSDRSPAHRLRGPGVAGRVGFAHVVRTPKFGLEGILNRLFMYETERFCVKMEFPVPVEKWGDLATLRFPRQQLLAGPAPT